MYTCVIIYKTQLKDPVTHTYESCCRQSLPWPLCVLLLSKFREELYLRAGGKRQGLQRAQEFRKAQLAGVQVQTKLRSVNLCKTPVFSVPKFLYL